mmetsp:Transcript_13421/g.19862  ORF Transcript_13421/g.19862 Transcript_13421/m.19862 type:complete len:187 (+) Transcript_13421:3-563(+)
MHMRMSFNWTGNPGVDFLLGMIPHHQGAIEMCDIYYKYWSCTPAREVCNDPIPLDEILVLLSDDEEVSVLNKMHHICTGHILESQPKELEWMLEELGRLSPKALAMYKMMQADGTYPCPAEDSKDHTRGGTFFILGKGRRKRARERDCMWAGKKPEERCRKWARDENGKRVGFRVRDVCPKACHMN